MSLIDRLADTIAAAHRSGTPVQLPADLDALPIEDAPAVQVAVMQRLGVTAPGSKVSLNSAKRPVVAPLMSQRFVETGSTLPLAGATGLEVEVALRLSRDITAEIAAQGAAGLLTCIDQFYVGIELIGSRLVGHKDAGLGASLADCMVSNGYVINSKQLWTRGTDIDANVSVRIDGTEIHNAPAKNPFGGVLVALEAYAKAPFDAYGALRAGHIITTGTLCGVLPIPGPCSIVARLGSGPEVSITLR